MVLEVNSKNFEDEVLKSDKKVIVDFWAEWCGPCKMLSSVIDSVAKERDDIKVCKVNIEEESDLVVKYHISAIPFLIIFDKGEIVKKSVGLISKSELLELL